MTAQRRKAAGTAAAPVTLSYAAVAAGLGTAQVEGLLDSGRLTRADLASVIPQRTYERRRAGGQPLRLDEADAIARLVRVRDHACRALGTAEAAQTFLSEPNPALAGEVPLRMARTDIGAREVEAVLGRFEHGVFG